MTTPIIPPVFASDTNYSSGSASGTVTKTNPGAALTAQGILPGTAMAQHINYTLNSGSRANRCALQVAALRLRRITLEGTAITDTAESLAVVQRNQGTPLVAIKTAQAFGTGDWDRFGVQGVPASITSLVTSAATDGTRILALGTGGNMNTFSDDDGATWTAGGTTTTVPTYVVWDATHSKFILTATTGLTKSSSNGVAWALATGSTTEKNGGIAMLSGGTAIFLINGASIPSAFRSSSDGGATIVSLTANTLPNYTLFDDSGFVAGNAGSAVYHCGRLNSGATIQVSSSPDGVAWTALASLTPQGSAAFASRPRILMCQNTGLLVIVAPTSGNQCALYASTDGTNWVGPSVLFPNPGIAAFGLAGGRLFCTRDDMLFASDGIGY